MSSTEDISENLRQCRALADAAQAQGVQFLLYPENFSFLGREDEKLARHAEIATQTEAFLANTARALGLFVLGGGYAAASSVTGKVFNRSALVAPDGSTVATYDKIHLFDAQIPDQVDLQESRAVCAGKKTVTAAVAEWNVGLSICYDVRFPELYQQLRKSGAEILTVPAAFTVPTGRAHWHTLLKARAIENQCFVLAPAQVGKHSATRASYGHTLVIDPWGEVLADGGETCGLIVADLDKTRLLAVREQMPVWQHKRL